MALDVDTTSVFFTEENYENFSIRPKFDIHLFQLYNPCLEGYQVSPVKKRPLDTNRSNAAANEVAELTPSVQPGKNVPPCPSQTVSSSHGPNDGPCSGQKAPKATVWNLTSAKPRFPYPRYSCLTHSQQQRYIELWQKHGLRQLNQSRFTAAPDNITEKQELRKLQILVHKEQQEFMKYAEHVARNSPQDYERLPPPALQYATEQWKYQERRVKALPPHFSIYQTIGIVPTAIFPTDPVLTFSTRLLVLGRPRIIDGTTIDKKVNSNLILEASRQNRHQQTVPGRLACDKDNTHGHEELHNDENALTLATKYHANIVLATAALATLADNHAPGYDKNWQIPVHIMSTKIADTDSALKTVYISGPLTSPYVPHEANKAFHRAALRDFLTEDPPGQRSLADPAAKALPAKRFGTPMDVDNEYDDSLELDLTDLETFGSSSEKPSGRNRKEHRKIPMPESQQPSSVRKDRGRIWKQTPEDDHPCRSSESTLSSSWDQAMPCVTPADGSGVSSPEKQELMSSQPDNPSQKLPLGRSSPDEQLSSEKLLTRSSVIKTASEDDSQLEEQGNGDYASKSPSCKSAVPTGPSDVIPNSHSCVSLQKQNTSKQAVPLSYPGGTQQLIGSAEETPVEGNTHPSELPSTSATGDIHMSLGPKDRNVSDAEHLEKVEGSCLIHVATDSTRMSVSLSQGSKTNEPRFVSDGSETEGDLMIALSSDPDSPTKTSCSRSACMRTGTDNTPDASQKDLGDHEISESDHTSQQTDSHAFPTRTRRGHLSGEMNSGEAPTPRRSKRLLKNQSSETEGRSSLSGPLGQMLKPRLPDVQAPPAITESIKGDKVPVPDRLSQGDPGADIPDSPLSPPPNERGLTTQPSSSLNREAADSETSLPEGCQPEVPTSASGHPQIKKLKRDNRGLPDSSDLGSKQAPLLRYNLRSKALIAGKAEQSVSPGTDLKSDADLTVNVTRTTDFDQSVPTEHCEAVNQHQQISKAADDAAGQNPKNNPTCRKETHKVNPGKSSLPTHKTGVESTFDSILKLQERLHKGKVANQSSLQSPVGVSTGASHLCTQGEVSVEDASQYRSPAEGCVDYSLWQFGRHSVIVKSDIDAVCSTDNANDKVQATTIVPKMEYQPHFGYEQISMSELTKLWMSLLLRPGSKVIQGRVNALTSDLVMLEQFDMNSALWEQPSFQPSQCMKMMFQILDKLTSLPEGPYLLCHSTGDMHACILQTAIPKGNRRSTFDLHHNYTQVPMMQSCPPPLLPWLPLDTNLILPGQLALGRVPATFPPKNTGGNVKGGVGKGTKKKKKKKKKACQK